MRQRQCPIARCRDQCTEKGGDGSHGGRGIGSFGHKTFGGSLQKFDVGFVTTSRGDVGGRWLQQHQRLPQLGDRDLLQSQRIADALGDRLRRRMGDDQPLAATAAFEQAATFKVAQGFT